MSRVQVCNATTLTLQNIDKNLNQYGQYIYKYDRGSQIQGSPFRVIFSVDLAS